MCPLLEEFCIRRVFPRACKEGFVSGEGIGCTALDVLERTTGVVLGVSCASVSSLTEQLSASSEALAGQRPTLRLIVRGPFIKGRSRLRNKR
jgi:hypothetical protein